MTNNAKARKRQRKNRRARNKDERQAAYETSMQALKDAELGSSSRLRMCTYKHRFTSEVEAIRAAIESSRKFGKPFRYYQCPHCGMWHLASAKGEGRDGETVRELSDAVATCLELDEQVTLVEEALNSELRADEATARPLNIVERDYVHLFADKYLGLFEDACAEEEQVVSGFWDRCEELGFDAACFDRFCRRYPERALYEVDVLREVAKEIDDPRLLGSAILLHWRDATYWAEEPLLGDGHREWFIVALRRLRELVG